MQRSNTPSSVSSLAVAPTAAAARVPAPSSAAVASAKMSETLNAFFEVHKDDADKSLHIHLLPAAEAERLANTISDPAVGISRIDTICGVKIADLRMHHMAEICAFIGITRISRISRDERLCRIEAFKIGVSTARGIVSGAIKPARINRGTAQQRTNGYFRLINCLMHPMVRIFYCEYNKQPQKDQLTAGVGHNSKLHAKVLELFNDFGADLTETADDEHPIGQIFFQANPLFSDVDPHNVVRAESVNVIAAMIKDIHRSYNKALDDWKRSGSHKDRADEGIEFFLKDAGVPDGDTDDDVDEGPEDRFKLDPMVLYHLFAIKKYPDMAGSANSRLPTDAVRSSTDKYASPTKRKADATKSSSKMHTPSSRALTKIAAGYNEKSKKRLALEEAASLRIAVKDNVEAQRLTQEEIKDKEQAAKALKHRIKSVRAEAARNIDCDSIDTTESELMVEYKRIKGRLLDLKKDEENIRKAVNSSRKAVDKYRRHQNEKLSASSTKAAINVDSDSSTSD